VNEWASHQGVLVAVGLALDVVGVILLSAEDLHPAWVWGARQGRAAMTSLHRFVSDAVRRILRRPRHVHHKAGVASAIAFGGGAIGRTHPAENASLEEKVEYLLREAERTQARLDAVEGAIQRERDERRSALERLEAQVAQLIEESISASRRRFVVLRRFGVVFVILGSALLSIANVV
jgi:hypothetical protein